MKRYRAYWMLNDMGRRQFGHDTFSSPTELLEYEVMDMMNDVADPSDDLREKLEKQMPNFVKAHEEADNPEDWKVRRIELLTGKPKVKVEMMMSLIEFAELVKYAYANLGIKQVTPIKTLWESFHLLKRNVSLAEFKILLKQLHDSDFRQYEMVRGSSIHTENKKFGIMSDKGLYCYFRYNRQELKCPHCVGGKLLPQKRPEIWDYDCDKCGRAWKKRADGSYESIGSTDQQVISKEDWEKWTK